MTELRCERMHMEDGKVVWIYVLPDGKPVGFKMYRDDIIRCIKSRHYVFYMNANGRAHCMILVNKNDKGEEFLCSAYMNIAEENLNGIPEAEE
jgi:hypothetical protein